MQIVWLILNPLNRLHLFLFQNSHNGFLSVFFGTAFLSAVSHRKLSFLFSLLKSLPVWLIWTPLNRSLVYRRSEKHGVHPVLFRSCLWPTSKWVIYLPGCIYSTTRPGFNCNVEEKCEVSYSTQLRFLWKNIPCRDGKKAVRHFS